jgi:isoquinoline 1-oxidoreductase alpha subunit
MAAAALLAQQPEPTDADIDEAMTNVCRCGTYPNIIEAVKAASMAAGDADER